MTGQPAQVPRLVVGMRTREQRLAYLYELDRSLGLDDGRTEAQERWRRIGPSARAVVREVAELPDPLPTITVDPA